MKDKKAQATVFTVILVACIVGAVAISIVATQITDQTAYTTITDDQFTMSNTTCVDLTANCITSMTTVENATGGAYTVGSANYTLCNVNAPSTRSDGILVSGDSEVDTLNGLTVNATYVEESCNSLQGGIIRTIVPYFVVLMAVVLLVFVAGFIRS